MRESKTLSFGLFLLTAISSFELWFAIWSAGYLNRATECHGSTGLLTLPWWIFFGATSGVVMNGLTLMWYYMQSIFQTDRRRSSEDFFINMVFCCLICSPVAAAIIVSFIFRLIWAAVGILLLITAPETCRIAYHNLYDGCFMYILIMAASLLVKAMIFSTKLPCD